jgi:Methyltransferase domain
MLTQGRILMFKYARFHALYKVLQPFSAKMRARRSGQFIDIVKPNAGMRVVDLGGSPHIWRTISVPLDITLINLMQWDDHQQAMKSAPQHTFKFVEGDACAVQFPSGSFDFVFSNSVIEHVGNAEKQKAFANEVRRLALRHWVQTPAKSFPMEAHTGMPFWWYYPESVRSRFVKNWSEKLPAWTEMVTTTTFIERRTLQSYFPESQLLTERFAGFSKSYIMHKT